MLKKVAAVAAAAVLGTLVSLTGTAPALAATSGCGYVCDGKDPDTYFARVDGGSGRCGYSAWTETLDSAHGVELRYSSYCRTAWARLPNPGYLGYATIESYSANGQRRKVYDTRRHNGAWTVMVNDKGMKARACKYEWWDDADLDKNPAHLVGCTDKF